MSKFESSASRGARARWVKRAVLFIAVATIVTAPAIASADTPFAAKLSEIDTTFLTGIQQANLGEIAAANLALQQSSDPLVRAFAHTMVADHTDATNDVRTYAAGVNFTLPTAPAAADAEALDDLKKLHGHRFDLAYMQQQEAGHRRVVLLTQREIAYGTQRDIAGLADGLLPGIQDHLALATRNLASLNDPIQSGELGGRR